MAASDSFRAKSVGLLAFKIVVALAFVGFGAMKLAGVPMAVQQFDLIGLRQGFRHLTGLLEVSGAVLLLPATWRVGALALLGVSLGAFVTQLTILHGDVVHTLVLIAATGFLTWLGWRPKPSAV
jgi:pimeloyl-ACP methyl ester carboxylesterase